MIQHTGGIVKLVDGFDVYAAALYKYDQDNDPGYIFLGFNLFFLRLRGQAAATIQARTVGQTDGRKKKGT